MFPSIGKSADPDAPQTDAGGSQKHGLLSGFSTVTDKFKAAEEKVKAIEDQSKQKLQEKVDKAKESATSTVQGAVDSAKHVAEAATDALGKITGSTPKSKTAYNQLKDVIINLIYNDNGIVGKSFLWAEKKTGLSRKYISLGLLVFILLYFAVGYGAQVVSSILGFVYPSYMSMKAIESSDKNHDTKWLVYWVVFGFINIVEFPLEFILQYIPFFYLFKSIFFLWCFLPMFNGSNVIYNTFLKPYFVQVETDITREITLVTEGAVQFIVKKYSPVPVPEIGGGGKKTN